MNDAGEWWKREQRLVALSDWLRRCRASVGEVRKGRNLGSCWKCLLARCFCMELKYGAVGGSLSQ